MLMLSVSEKPSAAVFSIKEWDFSPSAENAGQVLIFILFLLNLLFVN